jgi:hypothetical protein
MTLEKLLPYALWLAAGLLSLLLSHKSQVDAWAEKNPRTAGLMKLLRSLGLDPWMLVQGLALLVRGRLPVKLQAAKIIAAMDAPPPSAAVRAEVVKQSVAPPKLPPMFPGAMLLLVAFCLPLATACNGAPPITPASVSSARDNVRLAYSVAAVGLTKLADLQLALTKEPNPTPAQYEVARKVLDALHASKEALEKVKPWLETGEGEADAKRALREGLDSVAVAVFLLGDTVPPELVQGLELARAALGGQS